VPRCPNSLKGTWNLLLEPRNSGANHNFKWINKKLGYTDGFSVSISKYCKNRSLKWKNGKNIPIFAIWEQWPEKQERQ